MSFKEKVRKVFHRCSSSSSKHKSNGSGTGIKIEYYKRHEIPRSKFRGPFDPEHQKRLAAWSFQEAQADRPRSFDLSLSPCATLPDYLRPCQEDEGAAPGRAQPLVPDANLSDGSSSPIAYHDEFVCDRQELMGSLSSTAVDPESYSDSTMTLFVDPLEEDTFTSIKGPVGMSVPIVRTITPPPLPPLSTKGSPATFSPDDLSRALNAVQIYS